MEDNNIILCELVCNNTDREWEIDDGGVHYLCIKPNDYGLFTISLEFPSEYFFYYHLDPQARAEWQDKIRRAVAEFTSLLGEPVNYIDEYGWEVHEAQVDLVREKLEKCHREYGLTYQEYGLIRAQKEE